MAHAPAIFSTPCDWGRIGRWARLKRQGLGDVARVLPIPVVTQSLMQINEWMCAMLISELARYFVKERWQGLRQAHHPLNFSPAQHSPTPLAH